MTLLSVIYNALLLPFSRLQEGVLPPGKGLALLLLAWACSARAELNDALLQAAQTRLHHYAEQQHWPPYQADFSTWLPAGSARLPECAAPLRIEPAQPDGMPLGRMPWIIHCPDQPGWSSRARVEIKVRMPVWVAAEHLRREQELSPASVRQESMSLERLHRGFVAGPPPPAQRVLRDLSAGEPLYPALLAPPWLVKQKQQVIIEAVGDGFTITAQGVALGNGSQGELIRVRNTDSNKIIQARVVADNRVQSLR